MRHGYLSNEKNERVVAKVSKTSHFFERMVGLLGTAKLNDNEGLLISPCSSVHTFGMRYAIDVIFIDKHWTVVKTVKSLKPWRLSASNKANMVLEIAANNLEQNKLSVGQKLEWHDETE